MAPSDSLSLTPVLSPTQAPPQTITTPHTHVHVHVHCTLHVHVVHCTCTCCNMYIYNVHVQCTTCTCTCTCAASHAAPSGAPARAAVAAAARPNVHRPRLHSAECPTAAGSLGVTHWVVACASEWSRAGFPGTPAASGGGVRICTKSLNSVQELRTHV